MGFVDKNKFIVFGKTFYNDENAIITSIVDGVFKFR